MAANAHDDVKVQQIRRAAHTLFLRHGFAGVSTAALAKEAGVSKETLYSRFPNKDAVLADVLEHLIALGDSGDDDAHQLDVVALNELTAEIVRKRAECVPEVREGFRGGNVGVVAAVAQGDEMFQHVGEHGVLVGEA
ncbi:TetR/AcrR family transcriptional regulator, partial [Mycolicibacterium elephantis]|uniref:TetR/AcrR family transcriptional regulator n=1 Tax=Mycolicibacterium elephantis TaxID=81858 RepID=UPI000A80DB13